MPTKIEGPSGAGTRDAYASCYRQGRDSAVDVLDNMDTQEKSRRTSRASLIVVALFACLSLTLSSAWAKRKPRPPADRPWSQGVSDADQKKALKIFNKGNTYFETSKYVLAIEQYGEALKSWKHPAIHFNMTVCLINVDQPKEAHEHLQEALKWGVDPLGSDVHARALTYQKLLNKQLTRVTIKSRQEGVKLSLDGKSLFVSPGESSFVALPGSHQLVASKKGFLPHTEEIVFVGGETSEKEITLVALGESRSYRLERRWATWKPWTVLGVGAATAVLGVGARVLASSDFEHYDDSISLLCPGAGCAAEEIPSDTKKIRSRAELESKVSLALLSTGGAVAASGLVLLYLNRERSVAERLPTILPRVSGNGVGVSLSFAID